MTLLGSFLNILGQKIIKRLRERLFTSILKQETAFFDRTRTGELINRLSADTILVGKAVTDNVSDGLRAVAQSVAGVSMMVSSSINFLWEYLSKKFKFFLSLPDLKNHDISLRASSCSILLPLVEMQAGQERKFCNPVTQAVN